MKRYTGQKALYEAISRSQAKAKRGSIVEKLRPAPPKQESPAVPEPQPPTEPQQAPVETPEPVARKQPEAKVAETPPPAVERKTRPKRVRETPPEPVVKKPPEPVERVEPVVKPRPMEIEKVAPAVPPSPVQGPPNAENRVWGTPPTWLKPRPVQLNEGRIEVSVPYYIGVIAALAVIVVVLAAFRLGQARSDGRANDAGRPVLPAVDRSGGSVDPPARSVPQNAATADTSRPQPNPPATGPAQQDAAVTRTQGDHLIVLAPCTREKDFVPVQRHYAENGIELEMVSLDQVRQFLTKNGLSTRPASGDGYWVVVKRYFSNPETPGTDGFAMKQKVIQVGAQYRGKAPSGCESFGPHYFDDAYGIKIQ